MKSKMYSILTAVIITSFNATSIFSTVEPSTKKLWCIVGGSRGAGNALARNLCDDTSVDCTLFVRDAKKTEDLFKDAPHKPTIVEGDVTTDLDILMEATAHATYIVIAQIFPYAVWEESFQQMVINCIAAAQESNATLIYYGRIQRYGMVNPITESSIATPNSEQGAVLDRMEKLLEEAGVKTILITHSYPFGPNVGDGLLEKNFTEIPKNSDKSWFKSKQKFEWIASDKVKLQFTYLPDLAKFTRTLVEQPAVQSTETPTALRVNFAGLTVENINVFGALYCKIADVPYQLDCFSKSTLNLAAAFRPDAKRAKDAFYSFENELLLSNTFQEQICPFSLTPLETALQETYNAYTKKR